METGTAQRIEVRRTPVKRWLAQVEESTRRDPVRALLLALAAGLLAGRLLKALRRLPA